MKNLDFSAASNSSIVKLFRQEGFTSVDTAAVYVNRRGKATGNPNQMCVAFVTLKSPQQVASAIQIFDKKVIDGLCWKPLQVEAAVPRIAHLRHQHASAGPSPLEQDPLEPDPYLELPQDFQPMQEIELNFTDETEKMRDRKLRKRLRQEHEELEPGSKTRESQNVIDLEEDKSVESAVDAEPPWRLLRPRRSGHQSHRWSMSRSADKKRVNYRSWERQWYQHICKIRIKKCESILVKSRAWLVVLCCVSARVSQKLSCDLRFAVKVSSGHIYVYGLPSFLEIWHQRLSSSSIL